MDSDRVGAVEVREIGCVEQLVRFVCVCVFVGGCECVCGWVWVCLWVGGRCCGLLAGPIGPVGGI